MRRYPIAYLVVMMLAWGLGCANHTSPSGPIRQLTQAQRNFESLWFASLDVLGDYDFTIDRQDRRAGVVTTLPITGKHFFEFWRKDAATKADLAEGTVQTIYRTVMVTIRPTEPGAETFTPEVQVATSRSSRAALQITNTSEAYNLFILPVGDEKGRQRFLLDYGDGVDELSELVYLGRDSKLEKQLEAEIIAAAPTSLAGRQ